MDQSSDQFMAHCWVSRKRECWWVLELFMHYRKFVLLFLEFFLVCIFSLYGYIIGGYGHMGNVHFYTVNAKLWVRVPSRESEIVMSCAKWFHLMTHCRALFCITPHKLHSEEMFWQKNWHLKMLVVFGVWKKSTISLKVKTFVLFVCLFVCYLNQNRNLWHIW
jgi:hypothetical protein